MRYCFVLALCGLASGCWYTQITNGVASTRDIEFERHDKGYRVDYTREIRGYDRAHIVWLIPLGGSISPEAAIDKALDKVTGQVPVGLASARVRCRWFYVPFVYGQTWYSAEGYPIYETTKGDATLPSTDKKALPESPVAKKQAPSAPKTKSMAGQDRGTGHNAPSKEVESKSDLGDFPF